MSLLYESRDYSHLVYLFTPEGNIVTRNSGKLVCVPSDLAWEKEDVSSALIHSLALLQCLRDIYQTLRYTGRKEDIIYKIAEEGLRGIGENYKNVKGIK